MTLQGSSESFDEGGDNIVILCVFIHEIGIKKYI